jgi:hypothetical protein
MDLPAAFEVEHAGPNQDGNQHETEDSAESPHEFACH